MEDDPEGYEKMHTITVKRGNKIHIYKLCWGIVKFDGFVHFMAKCISQKDEYENNNSYGQLISFHPW